MSAARQTPGGSQIRIRYLVLSEFAALQVTKGTDSWLRDTDKSFGPDLPLLFTMHEIWSVDSQESWDFKAKMHQIWFWLGPRPDPAEGANS